MLPDAGREPAGLRGGVGGRLQEEPARPPGAQPPHVTSSNKLGTTAFASLQASREITIRVECGLVDF